jgi:hypothetical protein
MRLTWNHRLAVLVLAVAFVLGGVSFAVAQEQPAKPTVAFSSDAGMIIFYIKPDKTADFEQLMAKLKEGLGKLDAPEAKQQLASLKLFKNKVAEGAPVAIYVLIADPAVKSVEYWFLPVLYKTFPTEAKALFDKWNDVKAATPAQPTIFTDLTVIK